MPLAQENILLYKSLFRGRQDIYAVRWEKDGKSGYIPACKLDWDDYKKFKASGGLYKDYKKKNNSPSMRKRSSITLQERKPLAFILCWKTTLHIL